MHNIQHNDVDGKMCSRSVTNCRVRLNHYIAFYSTYLCKWLVDVSNHNQHSLSKLTETEGRQET